MTHSRCTRDSPFRNPYMETVVALVFELLRASLCRSSAIAEAAKPTTRSSNRPRLRTSTPAGFAPGSCLSRAVGRGCPAGRGGIATLHFHRTLITRDYENLLWHTCCSFAAHPTPCPVLDRRASDRRARDVPRKEGAENETRSLLHSDVTRCCRLFGAPGGWAGWLDRLRSTRTAGCRRASRTARPAGYRRRAGAHGRGRSSGSCRRDGTTRH
jgi:hypothetical protein